MLLNLNEQLEVLGHHSDLVREVCSASVILYSVQQSGDRRSHSLERGPKVWGCWLQDWNHRQQSWNESFRCILCLSRLWQRMTASENPPCRLFCFFICVNILFHWDEIHITWNILRWTIPWHWVHSQVVQHCLSLIPKYFHHPQIKPATH